MVFGLYFKKSIDKIDLRGKRVKYEG